MDAATFKDVGRLIQCIGHNEFFQAMHETIVHAVPVTRTKVTELIVDDSWTTVTETRLLYHTGYTASSTDVRPAGRLAAQTAMLSHRTHCVPLGQIPQLAPGDLSDHKCPGDKQRLFECALVSRGIGRAWFIRLHRNHEFTRAELETLSALSNVLLPLVERHATSRTQASPYDVESDAAETAKTGDVALLRRRLETRLAEQEMELSNREKQVCVLLLSGISSKAIAQQMNVSESTVQTYIKRAGLKLKFSGLRGLVTWMLRGAGSEMR